MMKDMNCYRIMRLCLKQHRSISTVRKNSSYTGVVGLEIHAQIQSESKLFSGAGTDFAGFVNDQVALFDAAIPGTLPTLNKRCVEAGLLTALALNCTIPERSHFDRKHYFYADMPAGYQITQQRSPLASNGFIQYQVITPSKNVRPYLKESKLKQIQLEQDSGKSLHDVFNDVSLVDLNRAGIPLLELVFEPDLSDGEEAASLIKELILILQRIGTCSCKIQEGAFRVDANVSVRKKNCAELGTRSEVKNIGSIRGVARAIDFEINRQIKLINEGKEVIQETRHWNAEDDCTVPMREKEIQQDYRFMPEPNLPFLRVSFDEQDARKNVVNVCELKRKIPVLPADERRLLSEKYQLSVISTIRLTNNSQLYRYFIDIMEDNPKRDAKNLGDILMIVLLEILKREHLSSSKAKWTSLAEAFDLLQNEKVNSLIFKKVLAELVKGCEKTPELIISENNWQIIDDEDVITEYCSKVLLANESLVAKYLSGKPKLLQDFINHVVEMTDGRVHLKKASIIMEKLLLEKLKRSDFWERSDTYLPNTSPVNTYPVSAKYWVSKYFVDKYWVLKNRENK